MTASKNQGTALITGASSGIGAIYADRFARRGYDLILVARTRERLEALAQRLTHETGRKVDLVVADFTDREDVGRVEEMLRANPRITLLVNNAGVGSTAPLLHADIDTMEDMIALNVTTLTRLTYAAAPAFVARGRGTIVNIASIVAVAPEILNGVYGGTKAFVLALSRSLRHELADKGVRVQVVVPGAIATEFWNIAGTPVENMPKEWRERVMSAKDLVDAALAGLDQGEFVTIPALPDAADWEAFEAARQALLPNLSRATPAARYQVKAHDAVGAAAELSTPAAAQIVEGAPTFRRPKVMLPVPSPSPTSQHVEAGVPDTPLTREATGLLREFSTPLLFNHSHRVFFWANELGRRTGERFDAELVFICAAFHDLGLLKQFSSATDRFEVDSANAVRQFLEHHGGPPARIQTAWDAIALHTTPGIAAYKPLEVELLYNGVALDVLGIGYETFPEDLRTSVVAQYPRVHFKRG